MEKLMEKLMNGAMSSDARRDRTYQDGGMHIMARTDAGTALASSGVYDLPISLEICTW